MQNNQYIFSYNHNVLFYEQKNYLFFSVYEGFNEKRSGEPRGDFSNFRPKRQQRLRNGTAHLAHEPTSEIIGANVSHSWLMTQFLLQQFFLFIV